MTHNHWTRRGLLHTIPGLALPFLLPRLDVKAAEKRGPERPKSLITVWLGGGASQLETWDPHAGTKIGGETKAIKTTLPGLQIADLYPRVAEQIHNLSVIRSLVSPEGDHERGTYFVKTGYRPTPTAHHPSLGAIMTRYLPDDSIEIPHHVSLGKGQWPSEGGFLGDELDAFKIPNPGKTLQNLEPSVSEDRQDRRLKNLAAVTKSFRTGRNRQVDATLHQLTVERSLTIMASDQLRAFTIDDVPKQLRDDYGDTKFGRSCLVARQLVELGVRAVEVMLPGWDCHASNHEGHVTQSKLLDPGLAALIRDLKDRDLLDSTVVLCIGEFGRTPNINPVGGRDHWPHGFSCLVGGGGLRSGLVLGETDPTGESKKPTMPMRVQDLFATIMKTMDVDFEEEVITPIGRPIQLTEGGSPIDVLFG